MEDDTGVNDEPSPSPSLFSHPDAPVTTGPAAAGATASHPLFSSAVVPTPKTPDEATDIAAGGGDH
ncbi:hypothetical protein DFR76_11637 [Nocardia pseudobrasiliensis]|uniref:Uncharacterized protein n=1 Tax=Nocardia pseudobrasiliensis TaxID=45979 RepID=A0A370HPW2_9NOCA|nr:hypothetical protein DFR76_11637 [Nocardia pseudobrasiliensis]